jgi:iron complex outermembrane receptor protein
MFLMVQSYALAQEPNKKVTEMTKEEIQGLSYQDLLQLPLEDLIIVANKFGLSADEMLEYFLNKEVTAASKKAEKSMESPLSATVISKEEIERSGAYNIPEALRLAPGVIVREKTPGNYDVHIRGNDNVISNNMLLYSENTMTLLMIDNRPVYNYSFGGTFWETLPIEVSDVERIEIIRGPSSALYGPNAVTGAINIITKKATEKKFHVNADGMYGTNNSRITNVSSTFGIGNKLKARLSGNYQWNGRFNTDHYFYGDGQYHERNFYLENKDQLKEPLEVDITSKEPDSTRAGEKYGYNLQLSYPVNDKVNFDLTAGAQNSLVTTSMLGNQWNPLSSRVSQTSYGDFHARFYNFDAQVSYMQGDQEPERHVIGFHIDMEQLDAKLEYQYQFKNLTLRPGLSYQTTSYDDSKYLDASKNEGYLNGKRELTTLAYALRADYTAFEKLRLIAAIRQDHYNKPDNSYLTYQFVASYKINEKNLVRGVVSRANRGPFMTDTYSDYRWQVVPGYYNMNWKGNDALKLPVMDMIEIGYRVKPIKNIQADFEFFRTETNDYSWFLPDSLRWNNTVMTASGPRAQSNANGIGMQGWVNYHNFDLSVVQYGASANIQVAVNKNLTMNVFGTLQQTKRYNFFPVSTFTIVDQLNKSAGNTAYTAFMSGQAIPSEITAAYVIDPKQEIDDTHKSTPSFYGGGSINYIYKEKWNFNASFYYYSKQTFTMNRHNQTLTFYDKNNLPYTTIADGEDNIKAKFLLNLKASYRFYKNNKVFVNARNLLGNNSNEFAFADQIGTSVFGGVQLEF